MAAPKYELTEVSQNPELAQMEQNRVSRRARINRPRWNPKEWHPVYEEVVMMDILGYKRSEIALEKGFTEAHITNILKTDQAKIIRQLAIKRMEKKREETIEQRLDRLANKAMDRVEEVINNDELVEKNPLGLFDRAITVLKGAKKIAGDEGSGGTHINKALIVSDQAMNKLMKGLELSNQARELHGLEPIELPAKVENAERSTP